MNKKTILIGVGVVVVAVLFYVAFYKTKSKVPKETSGVKEQTLPPVSTLPKTKILENSYQASQTFNNCAPAALSVALSHYGVRVSQEALADSLRPVHNLTGKNDDKSTTPQELGVEAEKYGLTYYFRPGGDIETLKRIIAAGFPVVTRTLLHTDEDFAHYRVVKGYDDTRSEIIQDDGYEGHDIRIPYSKFLTLWNPFNFAYLVLVPQGKQKEIEAILGEDVDATVAWSGAVTAAQKTLKNNPNDLHAGFNLSVALYYAGDLKASVKEFERIEMRLTEHTLWYQIEPIEAYFALGQYDRVFELSDLILNNKNPAYSELYMLRGNSYLKQGDKTKAKAEFEKAVLYNKNLSVAKDALSALSGQ